MKKRVFVLVSLVVAVLIGVGNALAHIPDPPLGPEWELVFTDPINGTTYYFNTRKLTYLPGGIVKVWTLTVPRGELRREQVNAVRLDLFSKGEDPNDAEELWYVKVINEINCKTDQFMAPVWYFYSSTRTFLDVTFSLRGWRYIVPGAPVNIVEKYVCKQHKEGK